MNHPPILLTAAWIAPMDSPLQRDAALLFKNEKIKALGPANTLRATHPHATLHDAGNAIILPGLINAHTHLELSDFRQSPSPASFVDWILNLMQQSAANFGSMSQAVQTAAQHGSQQSLSFGVTAVGDISKQCTFSRPALRNGPLRVISYGEIQAMAQRRELLEERFAIAADVSQESPWLQVGLTPHAPYTVEPAGFTKCLDFAKKHNRPLATHLAETPDEAIFLSEQTGPFRHLWEAGINAWDNSVPRYRGGPIRFARDIGLLDYPTLLAHVNYCDDDELDILAAGQASVVYCPRTHAYFNHQPHRWREMLARNINLAIGTDSRASSPDLNLVDDLRLLHRLAPEVPAQALWELATTRAAKAINAHQSIGSLTIGKAADAAIFPIQTNDPMREILENDIAPKEVWIAAQNII